jgi:hypothetical protein
MALVIFAFLLSRRGEGLARAASGPDFLVFGPAGKTESKRPTADSCEGVELLGAFEVGGADVLDGSGVDLAMRYFSCLHQIVEPLVRVRLDLVVDVYRLHSVTHAGTA